MQGTPNIRNDFNTALANLKENKATGIDDIPREILKTL